VVAPGVTFPLPLDAYPATAGAGLLEILAARSRQEPFNLAATAVFGLAILHTFLAQRFRAWARRVQHARESEALAAGRDLVPSVAAELLHFLGEVEVVFGLWAGVLLAAIVAYHGWPVAKAYLNDTVNYTEALFVVVIMALASTGPVLRLAEAALARVARLGGGGAAAWWLTLLTVGPLLGSLITEPAAMTICALLLSRQFYACGPGRRLGYATLGLLFVNISVGGTLTHFAAPPVLMVARPWDWNTGFMMTHFGGRAVAGILVANALVFLFFRRELIGLRRPEAASEPGPAAPAWVTAVNLAFMVWTVVNAHYPVLFVYGFFLFLGFSQATAHAQGSIDLKPPLLVGFFLAGLVVHGGLQGWWIAPVLAKLQTTALFAGAMGLTAFNDNALITYLATLVPDLSSAGRYAVVAGAVAGGGLTVIANAPNPAGQAILGRHFENGISPMGLLASALLPTAVMAVAFLFL
jgi:putative Na+/H+ antiporter